MAAVDGGCICGDLPVHIFASCIACPVLVLFEGFVSGRVPPFQFWPCGVCA